jgi:hypothetical protein
MSYQERKINAKLDAQWLFAVCFIVPSLTAIRTRILPGNGSYDTD